MVRPMFRDHRGLAAFKEVGLTFEIGRIQYSGNTARLYLPFQIREALKLDPQKDNALLLLYDDKNGILLVIHNNKLVEQFRPLILEARRAYQTLNRFCNHYEGLG